MRDVNVDREDQPLPDPGKSIFVDTREHISSETDKDGSVKSSDSPEREDGLSSPGVGVMKNLSKILKSLEKK